MLTKCSKVLFSFSLRFKNKSQRIFGKFGGHHFYHFLHSNLHSMIKYFSSQCCMETCAKEQFLLSTFIPFFPVLLGGILDNM